MPSRPKRPPGPALLCCPTLLCCLTAACGFSETDLAEVETDAPMLPAQWEAFQLRTIEAGLAPGPVLEPFFDKPNMHGSLLRVPAGSESESWSYGSSAIYLVLDGVGGLRVGDDTLAVATDDVLFVRGGLERGWLGGETGVLALEVVVLGRPGLEDPAWVRFDREDVVGPATENANVLNLLFASESLRVGAYLLPRQLAGDLLVAHGVDEVKVVLRGLGRLEMEDDLQYLEPGTVVYMGRTERHRFARLASDLEVLYVWTR